MASVNNTGAHVLGVREKRADARTKSAKGGTLSASYDTRHVSVRTTIPPGVMDNLRLLAVYHDITISSLLRNYIADGLTRDRRTIKNVKYEQKKAKRCED